MYAYDDVDVYYYDALYVYVCMYGDVCRGVYVYEYGYVYVYVTCCRMCMNMSMCVSLLHVMFVGMCMCKFPRMNMGVFVCIFTVICML